MNNKRILFRTDSAPNIGIGHLMRCVALAQYLKNKDYDIKFLTITSEVKWLELLKKEGFFVENLVLPENRLGKARDIELTVEAIKKFKPAWVVLDNYYFDYNYQKALKNENLKLICIDDIAKTRFCSDILINHGIHTELLKYDTEPHTRSLLGTSYALLRKEFLTDGPENKVSQQVKNNILITLGGGNHGDILLKIVKALSGLKGFNTRIIVHQRESKELIGNISDNIDIVDNIYNIKEQYLWADMAVCAAGGTCWELCYYGITGIVGIVSENQSLIAEELDRRKIFNSVGWYKDASESYILSAFQKLFSSDISRMRDTARGVVDGKGVQRVFETMSELESGQRYEKV